MNRGNIYETMVHITQLSAARIWTNRANTMDESSKLNNWMNRAKTQQLDDKSNVNHHSPQVCDMIIFYNVFN